MMISESFQTCAFGLRQGGPSFPKSEELNLFGDTEPLKNRMTALVLLPRKTPDIDALKIPPTARVCVCVCGGEDYLGSQALRLADPKLRTAARKDSPEGTQWGRRGGERGACKELGATCNLHSSPPPVTQATPSGTGARVAGPGRLFLQGARTLGAPSPLRLRL